MNVKTLWPWKMGLIDCPETSTKNCQNSVYLMLFFCSLYKNAVNYIGLRSVKSTNDRLIELYSIISWNGRQRILSWPILSYCLAICLELLG